MSTNTVVDAVTAVVHPIVSGLQLDLYDLEFNGGILRITIDTPPGSAGGVTLDQLALVNRLVGRDLDQQDPIPGHYTLEVTSPGLERNLRVPAHFQREIGKSVSIRLRSVANGERRLQGVLIAADGTTATIRMDDAALTERVIPLDTIDRARTVFHWAKAEKLSDKSKATTKTRNTRATAATGGVKPAPGPSDELDPTNFEEASTA